jgi:hypothetical protein
VKYQYKPSDSNLEEHERYVLKGWINEADFNNKTINPPLYDVYSLAFTSDMKLFAHYGVENA